MDRRILSVLAVAALGSAWSCGPSGETRLANGARCPMGRVAKTAALGGGANLTYCVAPDEDFDELYGRLDGPSVFAASASCGGKDHTLIIERYYDRGRQSGLEVGRVVGGDTYLAEWERGRAKRVAFASSRRDPSAPDGWSDDTRQPGCRAGNCETGWGAWMTEGGFKCEGMRLCNQTIGYADCVEPDGGRYRGGYLRGRFEGAGEVNFPGGEHFVGTYRDGRKHGHGTWATRSAWFRGYFRDDLRHGPGELRSASGTLTIDYVDDREHGEGYLDTDEGSFSVVYDHGKLVHVERLDAEPAGASAQEETGPLAECKTTEKACGSTCCAVAGGSAGGELLCCQSEFSRAYGYCKHAYVAGTSGNRTFCPYGYKEY
ncbi:MAG: hypothetical protein IT376_16485 [Polyangiaceae bacterium]|nr:hypothetical protein [Polyangiaceae bacterium]